MLDRPPQIQRHVPRVHPPTAQTWDLRPWRRIRSSVAAKAARGDQQGEHSGRNKSSPWLRNKSSITRATRGAREWATNWLPGDQDRGRQDKGGILWWPQVAATFAENVGVPEAEYPAAAPSARPGSGIGRMARTNLEKSAEIRGSSAFRRIVATDWASSRTSLCELFIRKAGGSWVSRGGPRRRFAMGRAVVFVDRFAHHRHRVDIEAYSPPDAHLSRTRVSHWRHAQAPPAPLTVSPSSARKAAARIPGPPSTQYVRGEHSRPGPAGHTRAMKT